MKRNCRTNPFVLTFLGHVYHSVCRLIEKLMKTTKNNHSKIFLEVRLLYSRRLESSSRRNISKQTTRQPQSIMPSKNPAIKSSSCMALCITEQPQTPKGFTYFYDCTPAQWFQCHPHNSTCCSALLRCPDFSFILHIFFPYLNYVTVVTAS